MQQQQDVAGGGWSALGEEQHRGRRGGQCARRSTNKEVNEQERRWTSILDCTAKSSAAFPNVAKLWLQKH